MKIKDYLTFQPVFQIPMILMIAILIGFILSKYIKFSPETLFWVSSTVAQSIAALIALVAMFYIYSIDPLKKKKNSIEEKLQKEADEMEDILSGMPWQLRGHSIHVNDDNFLSRVKNTIEIIYGRPESDIRYGEIQGLYYQKRNMEDTINKTTSLLKLSLVWAVFTIIISLLLLPFGKLIDFSLTLPLISISIAIEILFAMFTVLISAYYITKALEI